MSQHEDLSLDEEKVRDRAYFLWEEAGRPEGRGEEFWMRAVDDEKAELSTGGLSPASDVVERAAEAARKIGLQREFRKSPDDNVSGGFNQTARKNDPDTTAEFGQQKDDNIDDLGRKPDGSTLDQPGAKFGRL